MENIDWIDCLLENILNELLEEIVLFNSIKEKESKTNKNEIF